VGCETAESAAQCVHRAWVVTHHSPGSAGSVLRRASCGHKPLHCGWGFSQSSNHGPHTDGNARSGKIKAHRGALQGKLQLAALKPARTLGSIVSSRLTIFHRKRRGERCGGTMKRSLVRGLPQILRYRGRCLQSSHFFKDCSLGAAWACRRGRPFRSIWPCRTRGTACAP